MSGQSYGGGQGQGGTFGQSKGFNPQSLSGMPGFNNAMQRFAPPQMGGGQMPTNTMPQGYSAPTIMQDPMTMGQPAGRYGAPAMPPQTLGINPYGTQPTQDQLAAHMQQRQNITNGTVTPGTKPTPAQLAAHMAANAAYTTGYGSNTPVPLPPWLR